MKKAILPALIAVALASMGSAAAFAADRELLFGPETDQPVKVQKKEAAPKQAAPKVVKSAPKAEPVVAKAEVKAEPKVEKVAAKPAEAPKKVVAEAKKEEKPAAPVAVVAMPPLKESKPAKAEEPKVVAKAEPKVEQKVEPKVEVKPEVKAEVAKAAPEAKVAVETAKAAKPLEIQFRDALSLREEIVAKADEGVSIGFFPSATGAQDTYQFLRNYLPLANMLSVDTGVVVSLVPEREANGYMNRIVNRTYPVIFVNTTLVPAALKAGYVPVMAGKEILSAGYVVRADSKFKKIEDFGGAKLAWVRSAQITMLAQMDLAAAGLANKSSYNDVGAAGRKGTLAALDSGAADVAVLRSYEAEKAAEESGGKYLYVESQSEWPASGMWVKKELIGTPLINALAKSLSGLDADDSDLRRSAAQGFRRGFGVEPGFREAQGGNLPRLKTLAEKWPNYLDVLGLRMPSANPELVAKNDARPVVYKVGKSTGGMTEEATRAVLARANQVMNLGLFLPSTGSHDIYDLKGNIQPLENLVSDHAGLKVTMIPERNVVSYAKRLTGQEYPAVVLGPSLAGVAMAAGYVPVVKSNDTVKAAFVVKEKSKAQKAEDLKDLKMVTVRDTDVAALGMWELARVKAFAPAGVSYRATFDDSAKLVGEGAFDFAVMSVADAEEAVKASGGKLRMFAAETEVPALSLWVRKDAQDKPEVRAVADSFRAIGENSTAVAGLQRGYGISNGWSVSTVEDHTTSAEAFKTLGGMGVLPNLSLQAKRKAGDEPTIRAISSPFEKSHILALKKAGK